MASTRTAAACGLVAVLCGLSAWCDLASATATGYVQSGGALAVTDDFGFIQVGFCREPGPVILQYDLDVPVIHTLSSKD